MSNNTSNNGNGGNAGVEFTSSEKILIHVQKMLRECTTEPMKVLKKTDEKKYMNHFANRFRDLHSNYPAIFNLVLSDAEKFDIERLKQMLRARDRVAEGEVSLEETSKQIGKEYFQEYVSGKVNLKNEKKTRDILENN